MNQLANYTLIALTGFVVDCTIFAALHLMLSIPALPANLISATAAITLVYFTSAHRIFSYKGHLLLPKFAAYLAYQAIVIVLFSWLIAWLATTLPAPALWVKIGIVPLQFIMNYIILRELLKRFER